MLDRRKMFQVIVKPAEVAKAQGFVARSAGLVLVKNQALFATGIAVKSVDERPCIYYPYLQQVHVVGRDNFGYMLTKQEYRAKLTEVPAPWHSTLFSSAADMAAYYRGASD